MAAVFLLQLVLCSLPRRSASPGCSRTHWQNRYLPHEAHPLRCARRALTEMLVDKIIIERHPSKIDKDGRRHYLIRAIPYQDPEMEAERLKAVHEARVKIVPRA